MTMAIDRRVGSFLILLGGLAFACVSGTGDDPASGGPECYSNADCTGSHECSRGVCVNVAFCSADVPCRNNQDCLDGACRIKCTQNSECTDDGLICGNAVGDTQHCKPAPNPTPSKTQTQSGAGGTGSTGSTAGAPGAASGAGTPGAGGAKMGAAGAPAAAGAPTGVGGGAPPAAAGGVPGLP